MYRHLNDIRNDRIMGDGDSLGFPGGAARETEQRQLGFCFSRRKSPLVKLLLLIEAFFHELVDSAVL